MKYSKIACVADSSIKAREAKNALAKKYDFVDINSNPDVIVTLGGDGFMLHTLHQYIDKDIPVYGMNCGTVGFLLNDYSEINLLERLEQAKQETLHPLKMIAKNIKGEELEVLAINEVSFLRETKQAANLSIYIDNKEKVAELVCDGVLIATPAGSTAYNYSVRGPILPLESNLLALTPISPFRPRRWQGALLPQKALIKIKVNDARKRPVSVVADFTEFRDVSVVEVYQDRAKYIKVLFDKGHSLEERILSEQFTY